MALVPCDDCGMTMDGPCSHPRCPQRSPAVRASVTGWPYESPEHMIPDEEIERVHAHARFGDVSKRDVVKYSLLKIASGYQVGSTARAILAEHGLTSGGTVTRDLPKLTNRGRRYLYLSFRDKEF